jgi:hypothetical protein
VGLTNHMQNSASPTHEATSPSGQPCCVPVSACPVLPACPVPACPVPSTEAKWREGGGPLAYQLRTSALCCSPFYQTEGRPPFISISLGLVALETHARRASARTAK